ERGARPCCDGSCCCLYLAIKSKAGSCGAPSKSFRQPLRGLGESLFFACAKKRFSAAEWLIKVTKRKHSRSRAGGLRPPVPCASRDGGGRPTTRFAQTVGLFAPAVACDARLAQSAGDKQRQP